MSKQNKTKSNKTRTFNNVRDPVVVDATATTPIAQNAVTDSNGSISYLLSIAPLGIKTTQLSSGAFSDVQVQTPVLPWMYNMARNFEMIRITRARFVFVGNVGSTAVGKVYFNSSTDWSDFSSGTSLGSMSLGKAYDLSVSSVRELTYPLDVDTSWKKISNVANKVVASYGTGFSIPVNSFNDLILTNVFVGVVGAAVSTNVGSFFIEYDVEFKNPIGYSSNL